MAENDTHPVSQLLTLGETPIHGSRNYLKMSFTREHIPDLIRLVEDEELRNLPWDEKGNVPPQVYSQVHAWRALAQLGAVGRQGAGGGLPRGGRPALCPARRPHSRYS